MSTFPNSLRLVKGGIVVLSPVTNALQRQRLGTDPELAERKDGAGVD